RPRRPASLRAHADSCFRVKPLLRLRAQEPIIGVSGRQRPGGPQAGIPMAYLAETLSETLAGPLAGTMSRPAEASPPDTRAGLCRLMQRVCAELGAHGSLLVEPEAGRGPRGLRILACNWVYDAIEELGSDGLLALIENGHAAAMGEALRPTPPCPSFLSAAQLLALREHGHDEIFIRRLCVRGRAVFALFSARRGAA